ncbi:MAG: heme ABC transporter permease [Pseudomonadota bacterium]
MKLMIAFLANPKRFMDLSGAVLPFAWGATGVVLAVGVYMSFFTAPADYQQGETVRIMFVHVPAAWMAMGVYAFMAAASAAGFIWRHALADLAAKAAAPIGAAFTFLALVTGSLWGRPMWGTWWEWDARLTSVLVLFFMYLGYMALWSAIEDKAKAARAAAILCLLGAVNLPIIKFSVDWWNTLHQPASVMRFDGPTIYPTILLPLLVMGFGYLLFFTSLLLIRLRTEVLAQRLRAAVRAKARAHG